MPSDGSGSPAPAADGFSDTAPVEVVMGSASDRAVMSEAAKALEALGVATTMRVVSAHRSPLLMLDYGRGAAERGVKVIIAGAGGAAHLPGMLASVTTLPVIGVPVALRHLDGWDSLLSIVQMPGGVPVATVGIDAARNAGLLAARILATSDPVLAARLHEHARGLEEAARAQDRSLRDPA
ncbi:MAG: 5-(carboxyamino)imidazole ribonucleotide mutase [Acidobacteriota bacterium]|nr:5-(carboxyamino)imidazole ribonucleotide mutase [Acidobacteriota bacterium]